LIRNHTKTCKWAFFPSKWIKHESEDAMFTNAKLETSCKNKREPAKIDTYSVYYTKYPEQKWRRSIAKDVDFFNFRRRNTRNCRFWEMQTSGFGLCIIYPNYLSCFKVVPEPGQRNSFSKRLFVPQNTA
jgi:hypothetical protein